MKSSRIKILASVLFLGGFLTQPSLAGDLGLKDEGVGIYASDNVAQQVTTFTIGRDRVSCGVGTVSTGDDLLDGTGPFEMLMYSLDIDTFQADRQTAAIEVTGKMRSITRVAGEIIEDTNGQDFNPEPHEFVAFGYDNELNPQDDRFELHFKTPYWNTDNDLCTPSDVVSGGCMFGGNLMLGEIVVDPKQDA